MKDLVVLTACADGRWTLEGLLRRPLALQIRPLSFECLQHPQHDAGCRIDSLSLLRDRQNDYHYGLIVFDHEGSGEPHPCGAEALATEIEQEFARNGWAERIACIVIEPELDRWCWSNSPHVDRVLGWENRHPDLREWLMSQGWLSAGQQKPDRPKEAMQAALREVRKPWSASLFKELAEKVSLRQCEDPAFHKLVDTLRRWFPLAPTP